MSSPALMNTMSSSLVVRNTPACQRPELPAAAHAGLERLRDHLLERRIRDERVRQAARIVLVGAGELDGRGRAVRLAIARVERDGAPSAQVSPTAGLKRSKLCSPLKSSSIWSSSTTCVRLYRPDSVSATPSPSENVSRQVEPGALGGRLERDECVADEDAARHGQACRVECAELRARAELDVALVVREADRELVFAAAEIAREARLQIEADALLLRGRAVYGGAFEVVVGFDRPVVLVEHDLFVAAFLLADEARRADAFFEVRIVAVQRAHVAVAQVDVAGERDRVRHALACRAHRPWTGGSACGPDA